MAKTKQNKGKVKKQTNAEFAEELGANHLANNTQVKRPTNNK